MIKVIAWCFWVILLRTCFLCRFDDFASFRSSCLLRFSHSLLFIYTQSFPDWLFSLLFLSVHVLHPSSPSLCPSPSLSPSLPPPLSLPPSIPPSLPTSLPPSCPPSLLSLAFFYSCFSVSFWSQRMYKLLWCLYFMGDAYYLKAPVHNTIRSYGACWLPHIRVNRRVWHVALMSRIRETWVKRKARSIFEPSLPHNLCDYPIRAQQTYKTTFTLYDYELEMGSVYQMNSSCFEIFSYLLTWNSFVFLTNFCPYALISTPNVP